MKISILDAQHTIFSGVVSEVTLPAWGEEMTILDNHETIFLALQRGFIRLGSIIQKLGTQYGEQEEPAAAMKPIFIRAGLARMRNNELVILVE